MWTSQRKLSKFKKSNFPLDTRDNPFRKIPYIKNYLSTFNEFTECTPWKLLAKGVFPFSNQSESKFFPSLFFSLEWRHKVASPVLIYHTLPLGRDRKGENIRYGSFTSHYSPYCIFIWGNIFRRQKRERINWIIVSLLG